MDIYTEAEAKVNALDRAIAQAKRAAGSRVEALEAELELEREAEPWRAKLEEEREAAGGAW